MRLRLFIVIDIGSAAVSVDDIGENTELKHTFYSMHHGEIGKTLRPMLDAINIALIGGIAITMSGSQILRDPSRYYSQIALISALKNIRMVPFLKNIIKHRSFFYRN
jgi:hypothetical protein